MLQGRGGRERPQAQPQTNQWTWERFCREEAREAASAFLDRVRRFKARHAAAMDVHDSTFTNEFSAAFLEESSILLANGSDSILSTTHTTNATFTASLPTNIRNRVSNSPSEAGAGMESGRHKSKSWWSGLFKWSGRSKRSRERHASGSSNSSSTAQQAGPSRTLSTKQKKRGIRVVKEAATVQMLNLSECEEQDEMSWSPCRLMLVQQLENYQVEVYAPPRNSMPKMSIFCFLIDEVRSTTILETPDSKSCFAIKSQNHGEYVFDVQSEELKEEWVLLLKSYTNRSSAGNGHVPRSAQPSSHLATLPRAPSTSPHSSPLRSGVHPMVISTLDSSPLLVSRTREIPPQPQQAGSTQARTGSSSSSDRRVSLSNRRKSAVMSASLGPGDSEESVLVDMNSFMQNYSQSRSPNRQRKTMSMFIEPSTHIPGVTSMPNPYVPTDAVGHVVASPPSAQVLSTESSVRFPYASPRGSPPPPVPKRERSYSMFVKNARGVSNQASKSPNNDVVASVASETKRPLPHTPNSVTTGERPLPATPTSAISIGLGQRPLPATPTSATFLGSDQQPPPPKPVSTTPTELGHRPLPPTPTSDTPIEPSLQPLSTTPTNATPTIPGHSSIPATPTNATPAYPRPLPPTPTEAAVSPISFSALPPTSSANELIGMATGPASVSTEIVPAIPDRRPLSLMNGDQSDYKLPKRKYSQPILELPSSPHVIGSRHDLPTPGNLEACSQSSSSSALHPVSIAALSRPRKNSIPFTPTEENGGPFQFLQSGSSAAGAGNGSGKERVRKVSVPMLASAHGKADPASGYLPSERPGLEHTDTHSSSSGASADNNGMQQDREKSGSKTESFSRSKSENSSSSLALEPGRGFCEGEDQADHAMMSFPYFSQRSSPSLLQRSVGASSVSEETLNDRQPQTPSDERQPSKHLRTPPIGTRKSRTEKRPRTSPSNGRQPQTPPINDRRPQTPPTLNGDRQPQAPTGNLLPTDNRAQTPPLPGANSSHAAGTAQSRDGATSRNSNLTSISTHSTSSLEDRDANVRADSATGNPIFVETTEGQGYSQTTVHTRHPYEYWATNQQDITNLRSLSQFPWFHGMISRNNASQIVTVNGDGGTGQYLVRQSESREGDFVLTFNYHNRAKHLRMTVDDNGCNIQHLSFDSVPSMLEYFKTNSIPLESFWLNDDVRLTTYIDRQASDAFRTTTVLNVDQLNRIPPRRSRSLHLGMSHSVAAGSSGSSNPGTPSIEQRGASSGSTNSLPFAQSTTSGWRQIFRSQRSSSAGNIGRVQRSHSHNAGSIQSTGRGGGGGSSTLLAQRSNRENAYVWRNY